MRERIKQFYWYVRFLFKKFLYGITGELVKQKIMPFTLPYLVFSVGQACNYNCVDCGNMAPNAPRDYMRYHIKDMKRELHLLLSVVDTIKELQIQGGEPFLHTDLLELIVWIANYRKVEHIVIATNGSLIPQDDILEIIRKNKVHIRISDYQVTPEKTQQLVKKLKEKEIEYSLYSFVEDGGMWFDLNHRGSNSKKAARRRFALCRFHSCLTMERGRLARCSRGNNAPDIQGFQVKKRDYCELDEKEDNRKNIIEYFYYPCAMESCCYCYGTSPSHMVKAARQAKVNNKDAESSI